MISCLLLLLGFVLLVKGADFFVSGSSNIARRFGIPSIIIGMTIVAFGTSAPEAAVSITAALQGNNGIAVGNVIGSNIFNILVVIGAASVIRPVNVHHDVLKKDYPFSLLLTAVLLFMGMDIFLDGSSAGLISRSDGLVLLGFLAIFLFYTLSSAASQTQEALPLEENNPATPPLGKSVLLTAIGLIGIIIGGKMVVNNATDIALSLGISQALVGLTIVAVGTSLPELVTSMVAARKGESDIAMGNVIGSNLFNILAILSISSVISPLTFTNESIADCIFLIFVSLLVYFFCRTKKQVNRKEGIICLVLYLLYMAYIIAR